MEPCSCSQSVLIWYNSLVVSFTNGFHLFSVAFFLRESGQIYAWVGLKHCCGKNKGSDKVTNPNKGNKNDSKELSACEMRCKMLKLSELSVSKWSWSVESHMMTSTCELYWSVAHNPCLCWKMLDIGLSPALCWTPVHATPVWWVQLAVPGRTSVGCAISVFYLKIKYS